mmetsp:Transcript_3414/g.9268  ORF Transcript_3414/g.9268 Transcript_3414/m.9268 type:complete len:402 (+) Transcript_3414:24-1229(+)
MNARSTMPECEGTLKNEDEDAQVSVPVSWLAEFGLHSSGKAGGQEALGALCTRPAAALLAALGPRSLRGPGCIRRLFLPWRGGCGPLLPQAVCLGRLARLALSRVLRNVLDAAERCGRQQRQRVALGPRVRPRRDDAAPTRPGGGLGCPPALLPSAICSTAGLGRSPRRHCTGAPEILGNLLSLVLPLVLGPHLLQRVRLAILRVNPGLSLFAMVPPILLHLFRRVLPFVLFLQLLQRVRLPVVRVRPLLGRRSLSSWLRLRRLRWSPSAHARPPDLHLGAARREGAARPADALALPGDRRGPLLGRGPADPLGGHGQVLRGPPGLTRQGTRQALQLWNPALDVLTVGVVLRRPVDGLQRLQPRARRLHRPGLLLDAVAASGAGNAREGPVEPIGRRLVVD